MQKTKMGITVGALGAAIYFAGLFSGYLVPVILTGYVLLFEENEWLRKTAVKAVFLMMVFSVCMVIVNLVPNALSCINYVAALFGSDVSANMLRNLAGMIVGVMDIAEKILFIGLGVKALTQGTISIPAVDKAIDKYMG